MDRAKQNAAESKQQSLRLLQQAAGQLQRELEHQIGDNCSPAMKLTDLIPNPDDLIAMSAPELGARMLPLLAAWPHNGRQLQLVQFLPSRAAAAPSQDYLGYAVDHRTTKIETAIREAWGWLVGQALLIPDTSFGDGVYILSRHAEKLAEEQLVTPAGTPGPRYPQPPYLLWPDRPWTCPNCHHVNAATGLSAHPSQYGGWSYWASCSHCGFRFDTGEPYDD
jgi:hypothetical protein